jgi:hypothetical protein
MSTKLIRLADGTLVEVDASSDDVQQISGELAKKVKSTIDQIQPVILSAAHSVKAAWVELNKDMNVEGAEIEFGISFEGEGNIYITKAKAGANMVIKITLKPQE